MYYDRLNRNMYQGLISNSNHYAAVDIRIQITDTGRIVKNALFDKQTGNRKSPEKHHGVFGM